MPKRKTIVQQHARNFETLQLAVRTGHAALVECELRATIEFQRIIETLTECADASLVHFNVIDACNTDTDSPLEDVAEGVAITESKLREVIRQVSSIARTGEKVAVISTMVLDGDGQYNMTPFAMFFNGNPFELLLSPIEVDERDNNSRGGGNS